MSSTSRAWIVAASVGTVEAMKDHGNQTLRLIKQHVKNNLRSYSQAKKLYPTSSAAIVSNKLGEESVTRSEDSMRKVIYLTSWGTC